METLDFMIIHDGEDVSIVRNRNTNTNKKRDIANLPKIKIMRFDPDVVQRIIEIQEKQAKEIAKSETTLQRLKRKFKIK